MSGQSTSTATTGTLGWLDANFGDWVPCANYTVEWRGGKEPYALEPLVNYRNGSSALGVARPNLFTDSYDYFTNFAVGTVLSLKLIDASGSYVVSDKITIVDSGRGADSDSRCLSNDHASTSAYGFPSTARSVATQAQTGSVTPSDEAMRALGKSSLALGVLLALAILLASLFAYLFYRTKRQYRILLQKFDDQHHEGRDTEKIDPREASSASRRTNLHRLSTAEAKDAVSLNPRSEQSPTTPLSGVTAVFPLRKSTLPTSPDSATVPHASNSQNPFETDERASLRVSEQHRYSSVSYLSDSDVATSIRSWDASVNHPSEAGDRGCISRQSLYSDAATETTNVSNPVSDAHYHRTQARTIRRI